MEARRPVKVKVAKVDAYLSQVQQLTDQELLEELRELSEGGEEPGPITDTTRSVYQRQLARLMAEKAKGEHMYVACSMPVLISWNKSKDKLVS